MFRSIAFFVISLAIFEVSPSAFGQTTEENSSKIAELERKLVALREENEELSELVRRMLEDESTPDLPASPTVDDEVLRLRAPAPADDFSSGAATITNINLAAALAFEADEPIANLEDGGMSTPRRSKASAVGITANSAGGRVAVSLSNSSFNSYAEGEPTPKDCTLQSGGTVLADDPCGETPTKYRQRVTTLGFSAPASKSGDTSFATLDGLASGFKAEVRRTFYFGDIPNAESINKNSIIVAARNRCLLANNAKPELCTTLNGEFLKRYLSEEERATYADFIFDSTIANSFGLTFSGSLGYDEFSFFPDSQFKKEETEKISSSVGAGVIYFPARGTSLLLDAQYQNTYKAQPDATRCRPAPDEENDFLTCATGAFAKPSKEEKFILSPQVRQQFSLSTSGLIRDVAIAPRVEFDFRSDDFALDVPVYLVSNKKEGMVAGFRFGFEDKADEEELKLGVFYGKAFDLTPF